MTRFTACVKTMFAYWMLGVCFALVFTFVALVSGETPDSMNVMGMGLVGSGMVYIVRRRKKN